MDFIAFPLSLPLLQSADYQRFFLAHVALFFGAQLIAENV